MFPDVTDPLRLDVLAFTDPSEDERATMTLAAYLLAAGPIFVEGVPQYSIPPIDDCEPLGINRDDVERVGLGSLSVAEFDVGDVPQFGAIAAQAAEANIARNPIAAARAVLMGTRHSDELIRVCSLHSAVEFFGPEQTGIPDQVAWFLENANEEMTLELLATLLARLGRLAMTLGPLGPTSSLITAPPARSGLIAVHGTVLPTSQSIRPLWSVPGTGKLFVHLQSIRPDIYDLPDYFRWEGGYTDYAREVARQSLATWLAYRGMDDTDVVAHSHGCNVVMASTVWGARLGRMILLCCPVHWQKYNVTSVGAGTISIRIRFDFVILADRGGQRFPASTIEDKILPFWFTTHSGPTEPATWTGRSLDQHVL